MAATDPNKIVLEGDDDSYQRESGLTSSVVSPGQVLERNGTDSSAASDETQVQRNTTDGAVLVPRVALASAKLGKTIDDDYGSGDYAEWRVAESGDVYYLLVFDGGNAGGAGTDVSANANIAEDDYLVPYSGSGEDGNFRKWVSGTDNEGTKMFQALEAQDNSAGTDPAFVRAEKV